MGESNNSDPLVGDQAKNSLVDGLVGENNQEPKDEFVKHSTHKQLLDQHRKAKSTNADLVAQVSALESEKKERLETEMREQNRFKELLDQRETELEETKNKLASTEGDIQYAQKMHAFDHALGHSKLDPAYYSLVPTNEIKFSEDGSVDQENLLSVVNTFKTQHSRLIDTPRNDLPHHSTGSSTGKKLTKSEWKKLSSKEMSARYMEVDFSQN